MIILFLKKKTHACSVLNLSLYNNFLSYLFFRRFIEIKSYTLWFSVKKINQNLEPFLPWFNYRHDTGSLLEILRIARQINSASCNKYAVNHHTHSPNRSSAGSWRWNKGEFRAASEVSSTFLSRRGESAPTHVLKQSRNLIKKIPAREAKRTAVCAGFRNCDLTAAVSGERTSEPVFPFGGAFSLLQEPFKSKRIINSIWHWIINFCSHIFLARKNIEVKRWWEGSILYLEQLFRTSYVSIACGNHQCRPVQTKLDFCFNEDMKWNAWKSLLLCTCTPFSFCTCLACSSRFPCPSETTSAIARKIRMINQQSFWSQNIISTRSGSRFWRAKCTCFFAPVSINNWHTDTFSLRKL